MILNRLKQKVVCVLCTAVLVMSGSGCSAGANTSSLSSSSSSPASTLGDDYYIDPDKMEEVLEEIYKDVPELLRESLTEPTTEEMEEVLKLSASSVDDSYIRYSSGSFGLADLYVIKPASDAVYQVKEELEDLRLRRVAEFEQYDVYDALLIAQNAAVTSVGNYVVLIMMDNEDHAMELLKPIIPTGYMG